MVAGTKIKPSLILYYCRRQENESFQNAERKARKFADSDKFNLILFVTREPNHPGANFINCIGHYFEGMKSRANKKTINSRTWWGPRDLIAHLSSTKNDLNGLINSTGKSPIVLIDISPKCILDKKKNKWDMRKQLTRSELKRHYTRILSYKKLWKRIKLVIFSVEPSVADGREEKYLEARELFQGMIKKRYGKREFLNVPFFGMGYHTFHHVRYWGAHDAQMKILSGAIAKKYPQYKRSIVQIVKDYQAKIEHT